MNVQQLNVEKGYQATYNGVKGFLVYFYVYVNAWFFVPADKRDIPSAHEQVTDEQISSMKIGKAI